MLDLPRESSWFIKNLGEACEVSNRQFPMDAAVGISDETDSYCPTQELCWSIGASSNDIGIYFDNAFSRIREHEVIQNNHSV